MGPMSFGTPSKRSRSGLPGTQSLTKSTMSCSLTTQRPMTSETQGAQWERRADPEPSGSSTLTTPTSATFTTDAVIDFICNIVNYLHMFLIVWKINVFSCKIYSNPCFYVKHQTNSYSYKILNSKHKQIQCGDFQKDFIFASVPCSRFLRFQFSKSMRNCPTIVTNCGLGDGPIHVMASSARARASAGGQCAL